jgi:hypothetical protein
MGVTVTAGSVWVNGSVVQVASVGSLAVSAADATDRRDLVAASVAPNYSSSTVVVTKGTDSNVASWTRTSASLPPVKPAVPALSVGLAELYIVGTGSSASTATISSGNIVDKRAMLQLSPALVESTFTAPGQMYLGTGAGTGELLSPGTQSQVLGIVGGSASVGYMTNGMLLSRAQYAPTTASVIAVMAAATGLTFLNANLVTTFEAPASGNVLVRMSAFCYGGAAASTSVIFGIVSSTASPGTLVGTSGLAWRTPTAIPNADGAYNSMPILVTGLTAGTSYTWYFAASYSGTQPSIIAQGGSTNTTVPTGAPAIIEVYAA